MCFWTSILFSLWCFKFFSSPYFVFFLFLLLRVSCLITWAFHKSLTDFICLVKLLELLSNCFFFFPFIFISWRLITLQYCSGFCHILTWISHGVTSIPHPDPPSHLPPHPIPLGLPSAPALSTCLTHPTWAGDLFHHR